MAYDEGVAQRVRELLADRTDVGEKRMFGGLAFMVRGHMCCGIIGDELMVRCGPDAYDKTLERPHAREMDFTGRALKGFVYVAEEGFEDDADLESWVRAGLEFVSSLPSK
jgi:TfoX/Sxy family transcriptional regulator of competence genes